MMRISPGSLTRIAAVLLLAGSISGCTEVIRLIRGFPPPTFESEAPELPESLPRPAVLLFSKTNGFVHESALPACNDLVERLAREREWSVFHTTNGAVFNAEQLARFDVTVWNNVSDVVLTDEQEDAFRTWLERGGGFVGIHNTVSTKSHQSEWFVDELVRGLFTGHPTEPQLQEARMVIEDREHPAMRHLDAEWVRIEEWYSFDLSARDAGSHVLASLDESTYEPILDLPWPLPDRDLRMGDHPIVWSHCVGQGRAFMSSLGHEGAYYSEPKHSKMIEGAIAWAAGLEGDGCGAASTRAVVK